MSEVKKCKNSFFSRFSIHFFSRLFPRHFRFRFTLNATDDCNNETESFFLCSLAQSTLENLFSIFALSFGYFQLFFSMGAHSVFILCGYAGETFIRNNENVELQERSLHFWFTFYTIAWFSFLFLSFQWRIGMNCIKRKYVLQLQTLILYSFCIVSIFPQAYRTVRLS